MGPQVPGPHFVETHVAIVEAVAALRAEGLPLLKKTVASRIGKTPRTVTRHFKNLADALQVTVPPDVEADVLAALGGAPRTLGSMAALVWAIPVAMVRHEHHPTVRAAAVAIATDPANRTAAHHEILHRQRPVFLAALAARAGRAEPDLSDRAAVAAAFGLSMEVMAVWASEGFTRPYHAIYRDAARTLAVPPPADGVPGHDRGLNRTFLESGGSALVGQGPPPPTPLVEGVGMVHDDVTPPPTLDGVAGKQAKVIRLLEEILERVELLEARMDAIHGASARPDEASPSGATQRGGTRRRSE